jgi:LuxR family transcriptional regulator, maltose regulon positive regulatory protein
MAFQIDEQPEWLAQTKFLPPVLRPDVFVRPRLTQALQQTLSQGPVLLVSAPAGYGKTTLLASIPVVLPHLPMAWLSLDEEENDPLQLILGLSRALRQVHAEVGSRLRTFLSAPERAGWPVEVRKLIGLVINEIVELLPEPFVLVLDDLHHLNEPEAYAALDYLIERLPRQMHLVIGTRYDPPLALVRLRARGQMEDLRTEDLRFTPAEVATFFNVSLKLDLSTQDLSALHARLEGWAAGLRLLAGSFQRLPHQLERDSLLHNLARSERYVYEFLAEEVLNQQEAAMRNFLLETSILTELTPKLCQAVTGRQDAAALLEELYRRNLTMAVEPDQRVYRYHDLFKAFLQHRLAQDSPEQIMELHRRAAAAETTPARVIRHYLEAQLWQEAADKIEQVGAHFLQEGLVRTVRGWIEALPTAVSQQHPRLLYDLGICAWHLGDTATVKEVMARAIDGFAASGEVEAQGESLVILANACISDHDTVQGHTYLEEALRYPISPASRVLLLMTRVWQGFWQHDWEEAARDIDEALAIGWANPDAAIWSILGLQFRIELAVLPDGVVRIERFWQHRVPGQLAKNNTLLQASLSSLQAFSYLIRGRLPEAVAANERVLQRIGDLEGAIWLIGEVLIASLHLYLARDDSTGLDHYVELVHRFKSDPFFETYQFVTSYLEGRARWQQGRREQAQQVSQAFPLSADLADAQYLRLLLQALLEIADLRYTFAEISLKAAKELKPQTVLAPCIADVTPLLASLYLRWEKPHKALAELGPLLATCEAENTPGLILREGASMDPLLEMAIKKGCYPDFAAKLLTMTGRGVIPPQAGTGNGGLLSLREAEVLRLLADGLSNREIADRLVISELTVKSHVTHLLQKLDAPSRTGAVSRARQLGLIQ